MTKSEGGAGDIDIVVLWVDGDDQAWQRQRYNFMPGSDGLDASFERQQGSIRFRDWGLMRYWFRGISRFAPWVRKVHFVTCGQKPDFLNPYAERLNLVDHKDYIDHCNLPTFNSNVIEMNLHRIEGLSERFVYFNDDMFLVKAVDPTFFFRSGMPCDYALMSPINTDRLEDMFAHFLLNNCGFLNKYVKKYPSIFHNVFHYFNAKYGFGLIKNLLLAPFSQYQSFLNLHLPQPFLKSSFEALWQLESEFFAKMSQHRFRDYGDVNQYLVRDWQLTHGLFYPVSPKERGKMIRLSDRSIDEAVAAIINPALPMLCVNDDIEVTDFEAVKTRLIQAFDTLLPERCEFEL